VTETNQAFRDWLDSFREELDPEQFGALTKWLEDNDAHLVATVERGYYCALIYRRGTSLSGAAESRESLGEAVRFAQHAFDARLVALVRGRARVVGQA